ncbi:serine hydrolase [Rufibacter sp. XAAS-G3-1]|uniref:serine hydrolase domain-containing protein n=1 Tax=Rufibacter sp. XAAS-G3-1 TaxID=2729134 RepID=UPI00210641D8|nr:serine hydrolase domain-containing protein [Rufibacter sp. XAAS-G3-1]
MGTHLTKIVRPSQILGKNSLLCGSFFLLSIGALSLPARAQKAPVSQTVSIPVKNTLPGKSIDLERLEFVANLIAEEHLTAGLMPGMGVAVAKKGEIIFERGYGEADAEMGITAGPETVYKIGSLTKQFTAAIILRLVEAGKVSLEDSITKFLPDYPTQGKHVTIRHLLNHTSGIKAFRALTEENRQRLRIDLSYAEMVELFGKQPLAFQPGEKYEYNNMAYYLLGEIISRVTGMPYADYVERELLQPLNLNNTVYCHDQRVIPNRAEGYEYEKGKLINARFVSMQVAGAAGALCSTLGDLIRWTHLLHAGKVVSPASLRQMISPTVLASGDTVGYGYGLQLDELGGHPQIFHSGGANGFVSALVHFPADGLTIAVLVNSNKGKPHEVVKALARAALGIEVQDLPLAAEDMARYQGTFTYQSEQKLRELRVFSEEGKLKAQLVGGKAFRLRYQGNHVFIPETDDDVRIGFTVNNGPAEGFKIHEGRWEVTPAKRKPVQNVSLGAENR